MKTATKVPKNDRNKLVKAEFELPNGTKFTVWHNHPDVIGMSVHDAFENWLVRTTTFTATSFIAYVKSKHLPYTILSDQEYKQSIKI